MELFDLYRVYVLQFHEIFTLERLKQFDMDKKNLEKFVEMEKIEKPGRAFQEKII